MHPLIDDLNNFTDTQLQEKVVTLQKRYFTTMNVEVQSQISLLIDTFQMEIETRNRNKKRDQSPDNDLDNLINVS
jgi:hypothetical protein